MNYIKKPKGRTPKNKLWNYKKGIWDDYNNILKNKKIYVIASNKFKNQNISSFGSRAMKKRIIKDSKNIFIKNDNKPKFNSNYLFIKKNFNPTLYNNILKIKNESNKIIFYPIDFNWRMDEKKYIDYHKNIFYKFDIILFNSNYHKNIFENILSKPKPILKVIYHEFDNNFKNKKRVNKIQYIGLTEKSSFNTNDFKKYKVDIVNENYYKNVKTCIHFDFLLNDHSYYNIHTSTKLGTALATNSIFITNKIPVHEEILGSDYDLYINDDLSNIRYIINKAKKILLNDKLYKDYLNKMKKYKELLKPENISKKLIDICKL
jgi:hypothetical protein